MTDKELYLRGVAGDTPITWVAMSTRVARACRELTIKTVRDFMLTPEMVFQRHPGFGRKSLNEVIEVRAQIRYAPTTKDMRDYLYEQHRLTNKRVEQLQGVVHRQAILITELEICISHQRRLQDDD